MKYFALSSVFTFFRRRGCASLLAFFWCAGLVFGVCAAFGARNVLVPLMRLAVASPVSIVGLLGSLLLPFLFTALAVFLSHDWFILPVCFLKSFTYVLCAQTITLAFGNSAWLIQLLFLFSDTCMLSVLIWFWIRHLDCNRVTIVRDTAICIVVFIIIGILDHCFVSPYLTKIINI